MNIATLTPTQAGLETDHDLLKFDFVARPRRVKKPARYAYNLMTQNVPVSLKVYKIVSHSKRTWTVCMAGVIIGTQSLTPLNVRY